MRNVFLSLQDLLFFTVNVHVSAEQTLQNKSRKSEQCHISNKVTAVFTQPTYCSKVILRQVFLCLSGLMCIMYFISCTRVWYMDGITKGYQDHIILLLFRLKWQNHAGHTTGKSMLDNHYHSRIVLWLSSLNTRKNYTRAHTIKNAIIL